MKCISCEVEIDPKWKHAIDQNICPFCGDAILDPKLKDLLSSLFDIMTEMQPYPNELNDWMLSNFNFIKTDSEHIINYVPKELLLSAKKAEYVEPGSKKTIKVKTELGEEDVEVEKIQSQDRTNEFFKNAGVIKKKGEFKSAVDKTEYLKSMAEKIKHTGSVSIDNVEEPSEELVEYADPEAIAEYNSIIEGNNVASSLPSLVDDELPNESIINAMVRVKNKGTSSQMSEIEKLQDLQRRRSNSNKSFSSGGGSFHRG